MSDFDAENMAKNLVHAYRGSALIAQIATALRAAEARGLERAAGLCDQEVSRWRDNLRLLRESDGFDVAPTVYTDPRVRERNIARANHWIMQFFRLSAAIRALIHV